MKKLKVAVIGAGPSGLAQLKAFESASKKGEIVPEIICFEKQEDWGGLWNYSWETGVDAFGEPVHGSMYRYLWSNGPKEDIEFPDYTFEEHFGRLISSYAPRAVILDYIRGCMERSGVRNQIRFRHAVRAVNFCDDTQQFTVSAHDLINDRTISEIFDYVVVATGHFSFPNIPYFPGFDSFPGRILHAHDFRDALEFKDKNVLLIGASTSAEDIGSQCYKYGAKSITTSYRNKPMGYDWPNNWQEVPLLTHVENHTAFFKDGTSKEVDAIILCTGYRHHFPFLPDSLRLKTKNRLWPLGLYKGIFWENNPKLIYLGMQDQYYTFNMFSAQAWYARDVILGKLNLPSKDEMTRHSLVWRKREEILDKTEDEIYFQGDYLKELLSETDHPHLEIDLMNQASVEWLEHKKEGIMVYRDRPSRSFVTGTLAPAHNTLWLEAMDDSIESYLSTYRVENASPEYKSAETSKRVTEPADF